MAIKTAYLSSATLSVTGNSITAVVLPLLVLSTTGSVISAGAMTFAVGVPQFLAAAVGGVVLDRVNRRTVAIMGDVTSAVAVAALPIVETTIGLNLGWFLIFGVASAIGDVPAMSAREVLAPKIAAMSGLSLERLVAAREGLTAAATLIGPAIASGLLIATKPSTALWVTAGLSALAAALTTTLPKLAGDIETSPEFKVRPWVDFVDGVRYLAASSHTLRAVTLLGLVVVVVTTAIQGIILPVYFTGQGQAGMTGISLSALSLGMMIGAGLYASVIKQAGLRPTTLTGVILALAGVWLLTTLTNAPVTFVAVGVLGAGVGALSALFSVLSLTASSTQVQGRVLGNQNALTMGVAPVVTLGVAAVIDIWTIQGALILLAIVLTVALAWLLARPLSDPGKAPGDASTAPDRRHDGKRAQEPSTESHNA